MQVTQTVLDALAAKAIHLVEVRLLNNSHMPESAHRVIRNVCNETRDDIANHHIIDPKTVTESALAEWNLKTAKGLGLIA